MKESSPLHLCRTTAGLSKSSWRKTTYALAQALADAQERQPVADEGELASEDDDDANNAPWAPPAAPASRAPHAAPKNAAAIEA